MDRLEDLEDSGTDWSVSRIHTAMLCGRKYKYKYIDKVEEPKTPPLAFGTAVHRSIERLHITGNWDESNIQRLWSDEWYLANAGIDWDKELSRRDDYDKKGLAILEAYRDKCKDDNWYALEANFRLEIKGQMLRGTFDKIMRLPKKWTEEMNFPPDLSGKLAIIDYKTSKSPPDPLLLRVDPQLTIYHWAAKQMLGEDVAVAIHHLPSELVKPRKKAPPPTMFWSLRSDRDMDAVLEMLMESVSRVKEERFERNIDYHCRYCPFKDGCLGGLANGES